MAGSPLPNCQLTIQNIIRKASAAYCFTQTNCTHDTTSHDNEVRESYYLLYLTHTWWERPEIIPVCHNLMPNIAQLCPTHIQGERWSWASQLSQQPPRDARPKSWEEITTRWSLLFFSGWRRVAHRTKPGQSTGIVGFGMTGKFLTIKDHQRPIPKVSQTKLLSITRKPWSHSWHHLGNGRRGWQNVVSSNCLEDHFATTRPPKAACQSCWNACRIASASGRESWVTPELVKIWSNRKVPKVT